MKTPGLVRLPRLLNRATKLPSAPPMEANEVAIVTGGTVLWLIGFLVLLPFHSSMAAQGKGNWQWICLAGFGLGLIGIWYCRARRSAIQRDAAHRDAARRAQQAPEQ